MAENQQPVQSETTPDTTAEKCRNCGAELVGSYCHCCGQQAGGSISTIKGMLLEYLNNAFMWDPLYLRSLWNLVWRPGYLTNEFLSGRIISHVHPLKLNMFILFVFMTLFVICSDADKASHYGQEFTKDLGFVARMDINNAMNNPEFVERVNASPRDTVRVLCPLALVEYYPNIFVCHEVVDKLPEDQFDEWVAVLPRSLIEDEIFVADEGGRYRFNLESKIHIDSVQIFAMVWEYTSDLMSRYFPMIVLLTAPFLAFSLRVVQFRQRLPFVHHFIFSLHYISFLELLILVLYLLHLLFSPPLDLLRWIFMITPWLYLTIAFRRCYRVRSWFRAAHKALWTRLIYGMILFVLLLVIAFAACVMVAIELA